jgi:prevent-host-death family protein
MITDDKLKLMTISSTEMQRNFGQTLKRVMQDRQHLVLESNHYPLVVIVPIADYQMLVSEKRTKGE